VLDAPRQDWALYEEMCRPYDAAWLRQLTLEARFALYADMFNALWRKPRDPSVEDRLAQSRWMEKLASRRRVVEALSKRDRRVHGRTS
jgi:hypothetical protein